MERRIYFSSEGIADVAAHEVDLLPEDWDLSLSELDAPPTERKVTDSERLVRYAQQRENYSHI